MATTPSTAATPGGDERDPGMIKIEDMLPLPPNTPWGLVKVPGGFDWTATPMLAMQNITTNRIQANEEPTYNEVDAALSNILNADQVKDLLNM